MSQSFREILRNEETLIQLLNLIDKNAVGVNGEIRIGDFEGTCTKITTTINTSNPHKYSRRIAWTLTGRLLLGLTKYHNIQVNYCLEESRVLMNKCSERMSYIETSKTTKRKTKQVTTKTKNKKTRTTETEEEVTEQIRFWEDEPLVLEQINITKLANTTTFESKVTLREIDVPTIPEYSVIDDIGFRGGLFDDDEEAKIFDDKNDETNRFDDIRPNVSMGSVPQAPQLELDENMNNIEMQEFDEASLSSQARPEVPAVQSPNESENENPLNLLAKKMPLAPPAVPLRKKGGKRRHLVCKDDNKIISDEVMIKRISDVFVNCKNRKSNLIKPDKLKQVDIFSIPVMNGSCIRDLFARGASTRQMDIDWTTIQDAFDLGENDESNGSLASIDILRNENESSIQTRSRSRTSHTSHVSDSVPNVPVMTSTPLRQILTQQSATSFHAPRSQASVIDPPPEFGFDEYTPPQGFRNASQSQFVPNSQNESFPHLNEENVPEIESPPIEHKDLASLLGENSLEYTTMQKLMKLWRKNTHPINVEHLLTTPCNRFIAAKTFASLLTLKQKKLVQLENSPDGKIAHISIGDGLMPIED